MNKFFASLVLAAGFISSATAQNTVTKPKLSAYTQQYLLASEQQGNNAAVVPDYVYKRINNKTYISALIKVTPDVDEAMLSALGVYIGSKAGAVWTAQIPVANIPAFTTVSGISYIALDMPIYPMLDSARKQTRADSAQKGINLPMPVTGKNVVMGVVDAGFDFTHPTMYDTTHSNYRIKKVWAEKVNGTPPAGFAYGNEMTDTNVIKARGYDTAILSHGTHVTGIAAGSGYGSNTGNSRFRGMAYESDIALVGIMPAPSEWGVAAGESDIIDGMNYIYTYAASVGEPAVVNLSWGSTLGPHDGNSLFSQACDALTGAGKIFVCAAGNNGADTVHLQKTFTTVDTAVSTFVTFSPYLDTNHQNTWVDVWGDTGKTFCLNVKLYNGAAATDSTSLMCSTSDITRTFYLRGSDGDTCMVTITTIAADFNDKPHAFIAFYSKTHNNICLTTKATDGVVNMWEGYVLPPEGYYGYFKSLGYPWAVSGDVKMTVSDIGCTRSAITTGAYASKLFFTNISGTALHYTGAVHRIASFSSLGPTEDGRVKPDITAPGFALASSVNSFDTSYNPGNTNYSSIVSTDTLAGRVYKYAMLAGTSMASPCAAGIVGMMLQVNPSLTPDEAKNIINATAITDVYTGVLPATGTNTWGHGKINAYDAISYIVQTVSVQSVHMDPLDCILYPNPNKGGFTIDYNSKTQENISIEVYDITGRLISTETWAVNTGVNSRQFSNGNLSKGIYFTKVTSGNGYNVIKMVVE